MDRILRIVTAALVLAAGAIHLQEWSELLRNVPIIGPLFLVNVAAAVVVAVLLFVRSGWLGLVGAVLLSAGTLAGFLVARYASLFDYSEPRWRTMAIVAAVVEVGAILAAGAAIARRMRTAEPASLGQTAVPSAAR